MVSVKEILSGLLRSLLKKSSRRITELFEKVSCEDEEK
jgi:hypothetical protein